MSPELRARPAALWAGLVAGPAAWAGHLLVTYFFDEKSCKLGPQRDVKGVLVALTAAAAVVCGAGIAVSVRSLRVLGAGDVEGAPPLGRQRFMALSGLAMSVLFLLLVLVQGVPNLVVLRLCET